MRLKFSLPCIFFFLGLTLSAQKINTINIPVLSNKRAQFIFPAAFIAFETGDSYSVKVSKHLNKKNENLDPFLGKSKASYVDINKNPSYIFNFTFPETILPIVTYVQKKELGYKTSDEQSKTYVGLINIPFSFKIIVTNNKGDSVKELIISNDDAPYSFYFIQDQSAGKTGGQLSTSLSDRDFGFSSAELAKQFYLQAEQSIQEEAFLQAYSLAKNESRSLLKKIFINSTPNYKFYIKSIRERDQNNVPELSKKIEEFRQACELWTKDQKNKDNLASIKEIADSFVEQIQKTDDKKLKELLMTNAGIGYLLCRDYEKALPLCGESVNQDGFFSNTRLSTISLYSALKEYDNLSQETKTIYCSKIFDLDKDYIRLEKQNN